MDPSRHSTIADARTTLRQADAARTAGRKMIARGERPMYRVEVIRTTPDVGLRIIELPWLTGSAASVRDVPGAARSVVAAWLDVHPEAFDLAVG